LSASEQFVAQAYRDLLQREAEPAALAFWGGLLDQGGNHRQLVQGIVNSQEYHLRQVFNQYDTFLNRAPDVGGLILSERFLAQGGRVDQLQSILLGSLEYFQRRGGGSNAGFLAALYQDVLGRPIDLFGAQSLTRVLASGVPRTAVAAALIGSPE